MRKGFTLVELLVVISIIAILSVVGMTLLASAQSRARDGARIADINAIAQALEVNKSAGGKYQTMNAAWFSKGEIPHDPKSSSTGCGRGANSSMCWYCFKRAGFSGSLCNNAAGEDNIISIDISGDETYKAYRDSWALCANLENDFGSDKYYCKPSQQ